MPDSQKSPAQSPKRALSSTTSSNPRRCHPSQSKSLPRNKKVKIDHRPNISGAQPSPAQEEGHPTLPQGESRDSSSDQSAARWFASKNENVLDSQDKRGSPENESPFYLAQQGSFHHSKNLRSHNAESFGPRPRDDTENDELRGVIDDLTVENKKLKHLLRNWQARSSPTSSNPDRVVEVRLHGLPAEKKRELEDLLKKFATGLTGDSASQPSSSGPMEKSASSAGYAAISMPKAPQQDPTHTDSGYASISNSGMHSASQSSGLRLREPVSKSKKETDIENYLHDIPDSLFPRETVSVSENAKMVLVVQRLEQLFTGKRAAPGEHSLPVQQQKISRSAAKADRREDQRLNRTSRVEGTREAHILPHDSKINFDAMETSGQPPGNQSGSELSSAEGRGIPSSGSPGSPDQRPTRPLDLDIHRAQVAADNIEYIRHLGLSSPQFEDNADIKEQPWLYLNLLVSMAQLHTLNVTPAFIRKAVKQLSTKFELSKDGHKIRWIGRTPQVEYGNQESPEGALQRTSDDTGDDAGRQSGRSATSTLNEASNSVSLSDDKALRGKMSGTSNLMTSTTASSNPAIGQPSTSQSKSTSAFEYKPIVFQGKRTFLKAKNSYLDSSSSHEDQSPNSAGLVRAFSRSSLKPKEDGYEGYMTFFSNPFFFTDLSGDKSPTNATLSGYKGVRDTLGVEKKRQLVDDTLRDAQACYFLSPWPQARSTWPQSCPEIDMPLSPITCAGEDETMPLEFEASGLGGVRPEDNFALDVQIARKRQRLDDGGGKRTIRQKRPARYTYQIANCRKLTLQPSRLPPPSYVFFTASSSSSAGKGYYDDEDSQESSEAEYSPAPAGFLWQWSSSSNDRQGGDDDASVASSSLGVLEAARARIPLPGATNELGRTMSGSLAATAGASWSAASNDADAGFANDLNDGSSDEMSMGP
ncbi:uncharacterized protein Z520_01580 [Fonsecaea multimorphosa CBS 102226]|uniref:Frequency clock protein n=1 Tax=Fonsecaea multimorphosa CBS 102226 TaxID=1442371 RepID=A0A0D2KAS7_9EURO|nr:uncharacterized protein Z520_01580 [Fonsecaea multimorphosa CBS 102226]KIY03113.1 hypothetical protein Z520_01580 [Fonsecaea multimorphosa CBS 102226]OAL30360.1 hypothetical protein AYO22_01558 [Fonsecaea multimorphosa]